MIIPAVVHDMIIMHINLISRHAPTVFEITYETDQTFGLTGSENSQTELYMARPKTYFYYYTGYNWNQCQTICLADFQTSQTKATLVSHCPTDWPYFEHC